MDINGFVAATHSNYPAARRDEAYTRSYRAIRLALGFLGIALPFVLIIAEASSLRGEVHVRGSLSAYYHTSMQDIFVGALWVIGFLLMTYMAGETKTPDFWVSLVAGVAVLGVVFFPTSRSGLQPGAPACESNPIPPSCSLTEHSLGEHTTAVIHAVCAVVFILCLAVMSFLFALSRITRDGERTRAGSSQKTARRRQAVFWTHGACGVAILLAGGWAFLGRALHATIWELTPLYVGEVVSVLAFGLSWLLAAVAIIPLRPEVDT